MFNSTATITTLLHNQQSAQGCLVTSALPTSVVTPRIINIKEGLLKRVSHLKSAFLGYGVNKKDSSGMGEGVGMRVGVTELHRNSPPLY